MTLFWLCIIYEIWNSMYPDGHLCLQVPCNACLRLNSTYTAFLSRKSFSAQEPIEHCGILTEMSGTLIRTTGSTCSSMGYGKLDEVPRRGSQLESTYMTNS